MIRHFHPIAVDVLLVDDSENNLLSLKGLLSQPNYRLHAAKSGFQALALVLRHEFAVILMDVAMPQMDGFETAALIREREKSQEIPIIFVTASVFDMEHVFRGYRTGAVDYLVKPIDPQAVRAKVGVFAEMYRQKKHIEWQAKRLRELESKLRVKQDALEQIQEGHRR